MYGDCVIRVQHVRKYGREFDFDWTDICDGGHTGWSTIQCGGSMSRELVWKTGEKQDWGHGKGYLWMAVNARIRFILQWNFKLGQSCGVLQYARILCRTTTILKWNKCTVSNVLITLGLIFYCLGDMLPYILESNPHPFYSFRGLKNQMWIRITCRLDSRSWAGFWKNDRAPVHVARTIQYNNLLFIILYNILYNIYNLLFIRFPFVTHDWIVIHHPVTIIFIFTIFLP